MNLSDLLAAFAIAVSLLTAAYTGYEQYSRAPRVTIVPSTLAWLYYYPGHEPYLNLRLAMVNDGARSAMIVGILATIKRAGGTPCELTWRDRYEVVNLGKPGGGIKRRFDWKGQADLLLIPPRSGVTEAIGFMRPGRTTFAGGDYQLELKVFIATRRKPFTSRAFSFSLDKPAIKLLEEECVMDARTYEFESSLELTLSPV
jgi:hypothetical protein